MPRVTVNGAELHYDRAGPGPETVVMMHGLLLDGRMFDGVVAGLGDRHSCVTFDFRGQGRSPVTAGQYDIDTLTEDAAALIRNLGCGPCHCVGFSMGGFVAMRLAARHPELVRSLVLVGTSASPEPRTFKYRVLGWVARRVRVRAVTPLVMPVQFGRAFLRDPARDHVRRTWVERIAGNDLTGGMLALRAVIDRPDFTPELPRVRVPTLIVVGAEDRATPPAEARKLRAGIAGSELVVVPNAGHAVPIEDPAAVAAEIAAFLAKSSGSPTSAR